MQVSLPYAQRTQSTWTAPAHSAWGRSPGVMGRGGGLRETELVKQATLQGTKESKRGRKAANFSYQAKIFTTR